MAEVPKFNKVNLYVFDDPDWVPMTQLTGDGVPIPVSLANGGTGQVLVDPNADRILFWDDSAGAVAFLAPTGNLAVTTTTINTVPSPTLASLKLTPGTLASFTSPVAGQIACINDAESAGWGDILMGGGLLTVIACYTSSDWKVMGK